MPSQILSLMNSNFASEWLMICIASAALKSCRIGTTIAPYVMVARNVATQQELFLPIKATLSSFFRPFSSNIRCRCAITVANSP